MFNKKFILEKIIYLVVLIGAVLSFWYFEEILLLRIVAIILVFIGIIIAVNNKENNSISRFELLNLTILFLMSFAVYNLLYSINLPIYASMLIVLIFVLSLFSSVLIIDEVDKLLGKNLFFVFALLMGFVLTELFLSLYFWPIDPSLKSLILVIAYYQISNLVYLQARSMLRLKKISGYLVINLLILAAIFLSIWFGLSK